MRNHTVAIQGSVASFHDLAARKYFGEEITALECNSFREVCQRLANNQSDFGVIAIENKVAGSILLNYQLIEQFNLSIVGETFLPVELNLYSSEPAELEDVREIFSHPMALAQCQQFLSKVSTAATSEFRDTATCAQWLVNEKRQELAIIAGPAVAKRYNLHLVKENVCDVQRNFTRFHILSKGQNYEANPNKASVAFRTVNNPGSLCDVLLLFRAGGLNLTKIQSVPEPTAAEEYAFHIDVEFSSSEQLHKTMKYMQPLVRSSKILGMYRNEIQQVKSIVRKELIHDN